MFKRSLLATTAILACTLFASQAQAVLQTVEWNFASFFGPASSQLFSSISLPPVPGWTATDDDVILSGGTTTSTSTIGNTVASSQIQGNATGVGVTASGAPTNIDEFTVNGITRYEFVRIDLGVPLAFIGANSLTGICWWLRDT